jgi:hypothetical protein
MKKRISLPVAALLCLALLAGCRTLVPGLTSSFSGEDFSKAQRIVVSNAEGTEKAVLTEEDEINAFVEAVNVSGWHFSELPEELTKAGGFTLWQKETITALFGLFGGEARENEICTFRVYADGDYLTIETGVMDFSFAIPQETADYLRGLTA